MTQPPCDVTTNRGNLCISTRESPRSERVDTVADKRTGRQPQSLTLEGIKEDKAEPDLSIFRVQIRLHFVKPGS